MPTKEEIKDFYCIPKWCRFHPYAHFDGMGGCWGISGGDVLKKGEEYCKKCDYHQDNVRFMNDAQRISGAKKNAEGFLRKGEDNG